MSFSTENLIAIASVVATLLVGGAAYSLTYRKSKRQQQSQSVKGGSGIQVGGDIKINDR